MGVLGYCNIMLHLFIHCPCCLCFVVVAVVVFAVYVCWVVNRCFCFVCLFVLFHSVDHHNYSPGSGCVL